MPDNDGWAYVRISAIEQAVFEACRPLGLREEIPRTPSVEVLQLLVEIGVDSWL